MNTAMIEAAYTAMLDAQMACKTIDYILQDLLQERQALELKLHGCNHAARKLLKECKAKTREVLERRDRLLSRSLHLREVYENQTKQQQRHKASASSVPTIDRRRAFP